MKIRFLVLPFLAIIAVIVIGFSSCKHINESTDLGGGLIPPIDNVTTFDTSLTVETYNNIFALAADSQRATRDDEYFLGRINSDPFFGKTDARMFLELKPSAYKFAFGNSDPTKLRIDSVVMILDYLETYGDSTIPQTVNVYEIDQSADFRADSSYLIRQNNFTYSNLLGSRTFTPQILDDSVKAFRDTTSHQLRIKLNNSFGTRLLGYDSTATGAYASDSVFRTKFKGFALQSMNTGEALMGFKLSGSANTKLAIYYRYDKAPIFDTAVVAYFNFNGTTAFDFGASAAANYIQRDYSGTPVQATSGDAVQDQAVYIQNSPGTYANIKIPALGTLNNRLIYRAELIVEELYHPTDATYTPPAYLYLDASDPSITASNNKFRTIPYDLQYVDQSGFDFGGLGCLPVTAQDGLGNTIKTWKFNISRYVQHVLTHTQSLYDLRLTAPYVLSESYGIPPGADVVIPFILNPAIAKGRIRVGGGNHPTQRMRLRLIYSKL